ncbi:uncharacterized protein LOC127846590 [Dreissena polymorpha]|uniref:uncharacterized protein LOC127846590 n=1 Tax=Dreissena polymorpha TaxID=45954 RepID=UPI00226522A6|nr:uncharacterized protein LOC127846590 [Dreissena polymorpha]
MSQIFQRYNGIQGADDTVSQGLNTLFIVMDCCGVSPVSPFANDFQLLRTNYWINVGMRGPNTIPYSCCREATLDNYKFGQNLACTVAQQAPLVRPRGCYEAFRQLATDVSTGAIVILVIVMVTELLAVMSAIIMVRAIDREKNNTLDPSNPKMYRGREIPLPDSKPR